LILCLAFARGRTAAPRANRRFSSKAAVRAAPPWDSLSVKIAAAIGLVATSLLVSACGGGDHPQAPDIADGSATVRCTDAILGSGDPNWRLNSTVLGRIGFYGTGRNFLTEPTKRAKVPVFVEGHQPITVSIAPADRGHAGLLFGNFGNGGPYAQVRFVPCRDRPRTPWPGGFLLRNQQPVRLIVHQPGRPPGVLRVGRL
jgi:hypothetical protein